MDASTANLIESPKYVGRDGWYFFSQDSLLTELNHKYSATKSQQKIIQINKKVQVAGIMLIDTIVCDYLPDRIGTSKGEVMQALDGSYPH